MSEGAAPVGRPAGLAHRGGGGLARRLAWRLAVVMLAGVGLAAAAVAWRTIATIRSIDDAALQSQAQLVASQLAAGPDGRPTLQLPGTLAARFRESDDGSFFLVYGRSDHALIAWDANAAAAVGPFVPPPPATGLFRVPPSVDYPEGMLGAVIDAGPWRVVVAQTHEQSQALLDSVLHEFLFSTLWLLLPIGAMTVLIGVVTIVQGLRPLREASEAAACVGPDRPGVRLPEAGMPAEVQPLVAAVNEALARLEQAIDAQRRFFAEAAHALRTPLAVLTARIDELPTAPETAALRGDVNRVTRLVGQMLAMARLEDLPLDLTGTVDLHRVAVEVISDLAPLAIRRQVELMLTERERPPPIRGNAAAVALALTNLLDNALAYAPAGTAVEVELAAPATIRVSDRGPGVPAAERQAIFARYHRARGARPAGAGLGLAIVAEIASAHGGSVWVEERAGGGAEFTLDLGGMLRVAAAEERSGDLAPLRRSRGQGVLSRRPDHGASAAPGESRDDDARRLPISSPTQAASTIGS